MFLLCHPDIQKRSGGEWQNAGNVGIRIRANHVDSSCKNTNAKICAVVLAEMLARYPEVKLQIFVSETSLFRKKTNRG